MGNCVDLITVKDAIGTAKFTTTQRYDLRSQDRLKWARDRLPLICTYQHVKTLLCEKQATLPNGRGSSSMMKNAASFHLEVNLYIESYCALLLFFVLL